MFIREKTIWGHTPPLGAVDYREGSKVRQRVITTSGKKEELVSSGQIGDDSAHPSPLLRQSQVNVGLTGGRRKGTRRPGLESTCRCSSEKR